MESVTRFPALENKGQRKQACASLGCQRRVPVPRLPPPPDKQHHIDEFLSVWVACSYLATCITDRSSLKRQGEIGRSQHGESRSSDIDENEQGRCVQA